MLQEILLPLAKSCRLIYNRPGDYHLLCFSFSSFTELPVGDGWSCPPPPPPPISQSRPLFSFPFLPPRRPGSLLRGRLECDLWPWPLTLAPLMTVVNWWEAKGRAFLCSVVICCGSARPAEHGQSWGKYPEKNKTKQKKLPVKFSIRNVGKKMKFYFCWTLGWANTVFTFSTLGLARRNPENFGSVVLLLDHT